MKILHTSDWHLGNRLMEQSRQQEFAAFLNHVLCTLKEQQVDALLICGDVFDSTTPSDQARELYCDFLSRVDETGCRHTIITGGNHDSVQQLRVAAPLLARHHACVIPNLRVENAADCLIPLLDADGQPAALVAAVPFLRPSEVSRRVPAEDAEARRHAYVDGVADCYAAVAAAVRDWKAEDSTRTALPVIAMGHLALGGASVTDSTRPAVIGAVDAVSGSIFDPVFDYVALGHIHQPASHGGGRLRYCGSPLPMGFDEAALPHEMLLLEISPGRCDVIPLPVPRFALYEDAVCASAAEVDSLLARVKEAAEAPCRASAQAAPLPVWLRLTYTGGDQSLKDLLASLGARAAECHLKNFRAMRPESSLPAAAAEVNAGLLPTLQDMEPRQLFARRLAEWGEELECPPSEDDCAQLSALFAGIAAEAAAELNSHPDSPSTHED